MSLNPERLATRGLEEHGIRNIIAAHWNLGPTELLEHAIARREGSFAVNGAFVVRTGQFTGRSPKDKFISRDDVSDAQVDWGAVNQPLSEERFEAIRGRMLAFWQGHEVYVQDCVTGADPEFSLRVRVITQFAWHALFARQLFIPAPEDPKWEPQFTVLFAPDFQVDPVLDGTNSETCIALSFKRRTALICGTSYAGEMKKSAFSVMNYLLPPRGVLPMHCSANIGPEGDTALFFGLSGTGKTTLSADPSRRLIGDDEHGWSDRGVFNFEGGCYAKCIRLSREQEPQIWNALRFGAVLENVVLDAATRKPDFDSDAITENTRAAYPLEFIENAVIPGVGGHPRNVMLLAADAFGVLPPISHLTPAQAMYHFLSGYTARLAGTERGLGSHPQATFSACFGAPFLPRPAAVYAKLLGEKLRRHGVSCWLVNTGWVGGPAGVGERMKLPYTRAMLNAALSGSLRGVPMRVDPVFGVETPSRCPGVPDRFLDARSLWPDPAAYDAAAKNLATLFRQNFQRFQGVEPEIAQAGPA